MQKYHQQTIIKGRESHPRTIAKQKGKKVGQSGTSLHLKTSRGVKDSWEDSWGGKNSNQIHLAYYLQRWGTGAGEW